jgi:hypothetical protein
MPASQLQKEVKDKELSLSRQTDRAFCRQEAQESITDAHQLISNWGALEIVACVTF